MQLSGPLKIIQYSLGDTQEYWERKTTCWGERWGRGWGRGANSYDRKKALFSIHLSVLSDLECEGILGKTLLRTNKAGFCYLQRARIMLQRGRGGDEAKIMYNTLAIAHACRKAGSRFDSRLGTSEAESIYIFIEDQDFFWTYHSAACPPPSPPPLPWTSWLSSSAFLCVAGRAY